MPAVTPASTATLVRQYSTIKLLCCTAFSLSVFPSVSSIAVSHASSHSHNYKAGMPRGGKIMAHHGPSSSRQSEVTPTIAAMLQELSQLIRQTESERTRGEHTLLNIGKTHQKMREELRVSPYFKQKLQNLYANALQEAKHEQAMVNQAISKIVEIKQELGEKKSRPTTQQRKIEDVTTRRTGMRKGMLMNVLQQYAFQQPVWRGKPGEDPPPLCGAVQAEDKHKCKPDDQVAARVTTEDGDEEQWILAAVVSYNSHYHRYVVDDIDEEGHNEKRRYHVSKRRVIPLPNYKVDPATTLKALFRPGQHVLALYPQTTCFYPAVIHEPPADVDSDYSVLFEDTTYQDGYSPPLEVPQRYVLPMRETRKRHN